MTIHDKEYWEKRTRENKHSMQALLFRDNRFYAYEILVRGILQSFINGTVLDVACGPGRFANIFAKESYEGWDFSDEMIKLAKERNPKYSFEVHDIRRDSPTKKYNFVIEVNSLHSLAMSTEQFFEKFKPYAKEFVACLEADQFTIYPIYDAKT